MFPGIVALIFFVLNLFIWGERSSGAVPFTTLIILFLMWFGVSVRPHLLCSLKGQPPSHSRPPSSTDQARSIHVPLDRTTASRPVGASGIRWLVLWVQTASNRLSYQDQLDTQSNPTTAVVHAADLLDHGAPRSQPLQISRCCTSLAKTPFTVHCVSTGGRYIALWCCFHRALLHPLVYLAPPGYSSLESCTFPL